jgi:hypothetical protein
MKRTILLFTVVCLLISFWLFSASDPGNGDWPMWGGTPQRNMVSLMEGIPTSWDITTKKNVKWVAQLGSQSYGNPVVSGGQVYVGTNNELVPSKNSTHGSSLPQQCPRGASFRWIMDRVSFRGLPGRHAFGLGTIGCIQPRNGPRTAL